MEAADTLSMPRCPACDKPVSLEGLATAPFCSDRCRLIDLGRWLEESHALPVPATDPDEEDDEPPPNAIRSDDFEDA